MKYFVFDRCPFCNKAYELELNLSTVGDVLKHDKECLKNPKNEVKA